MSNDPKHFSRDAHRSEAGQLFTAGGREYHLMGGVDNGAIGIVRKARDVETQRIVAIKFLAPEFRYIEASSWPDIRERFRREGQKGTALEHANLVKILAYEDNLDGHCFHNSASPWNPFIVMEFVQGKTLESFIRSQIKQRGPGTFNVSPHTLRIAIAITAEFQSLFDLILDMLAQGPTSRPTATRVRGRLRFLMEHLDNDFHDPA